MDEYLSDKEQVERLRQWWGENGWFLIGGAAIALLGFYGYRQYQAYQVGQSEKAAVIYQSLKTAVDDNKPGDADTLLAKLRADFPSNPYTQQGGLLVAKFVLASAPDRAADELRFVMEHSKDPELGLVARLRLARVLAYREKYDDALAVLTVADPGQFAGRFNEVKGDIYAARGRIDEARAAYLAALVADGSELLDRSFLQMKLNDLPGSAPETAAPAPGEPAAGAPAAPSTAEPAPAAKSEAGEGA
ncbi:MAG TPA: tetratricopeptide repeat protein [Gammaproteobacteria bacterium]|nr:tetratricopeptide repeat protein [Gammaproteobacteria bacterium]